MTGPLPSNDGSIRTVENTVRKDIFTSISRKIFSLSFVLSLGAGCMVFLFSDSSLAILSSQCEEVDQEDYYSYKKVYEHSPGDVRIIYNMSTLALCTENKAEGMALLEKAADGGHVNANRLMGKYYEQDKSFDTSKRTDDPHNYNAMLFYYERAARLIENNPQYPEGTYSDASYLEEHNRVSAKVFVALPGFYFDGYNVAVGDILNSAEKVSYTDTLETLGKMLDSAERCLQRPALAVWKSKRAEIGHALKVRCRAMWDFANEALPLEEKRIAIAERCEVPLKECPEHQEIINALIGLANTRRKKSDSVPLL